MKDEEQIILTEKRKNELIDIMWKAKAMVAFVWNETKNNEVGDTMCSIGKSPQQVEGLFCEEKVIGL